MIILTFIEAINLCVLRVFVVLSSRSLAGLYHENTLYPPNPREPLNREKIKLCQGNYLWQKREIRGSELEDLGTICLNRVECTFFKITRPTSLQQKVLDLLGVSLICTQ